MTRLARQLYFWVLVAIVAGAVLGLVNPPAAVALKPLGDGFNVDPATLDANAVAAYSRTAAEQTTVGFILHIIPATFIDALTGSGDLLQVLFVAILFGYAISRSGAAGGSVTTFIGNGVATIVVSRWEGELDADILARELHAQHPDELADRVG